MLGRPHNKAGVAPNKPPGSVLSVRTGANGCSLAGVRAEIGSGESHISAGSQTRIFGQKPSPDRERASQRETRATISPSELEANYHTWLPSLYRYPPLPSHFPAPLLHFFVVVSSVVASETDS